ncbi:hypothetical protein HD553DRAFT_271332 [Filobasidium floriforme]|uniref:uncharacterized protein n=1 Tax=Filobasidium floriforme TaxID=5210 RepID=UPI001E8D8474|nr:uncharacterized protein HD553DRAFT_271332 [Filobasidium floriforme]KAH8085911.1 hypothetical protein HD553DRAFT_271332 [Filobasidium floriforme]
MNKSLRSWHIHQHVLTIVCDNASANDVMIDKLADNDWARFNSSSKGRVRCFAHILNLVTGVSITE